MAGKDAVGLADPAAAFADRIIVVSPHIDDETLGCGGLMAHLASTRDIHVVFATDSARSPERPDGVGADPAGLMAIREEEARAAMAVLGVPAGNLEFLRFPDGRLTDVRDALRRALAGYLKELGDADVLVPFRFDWHPDHVATFWAASAAYRAGEIGGRLLEYFVYTQRRLLPGGDVRAYVRPGQGIRVDTEDVRERKLRALECFRSQTTLFYDWQRRPILTPRLLRRMCSDPECFLPWDPAAETKGLRAPRLLRVATSLEPPLKRAKDGIVEWLRR